MKNKFPDHATLKCIDSYGLNVLTPLCVGSNVNEKNHTSKCIEIVPPSGKYRLSSINSTSYS